MIDYKELSNDGEQWELFARDFFEALGYTIDNPPDRGADGGKDLLISESIKGRFSSYTFKWLVSCKNFIKSNKSVNEREDEVNILERCKSFKADGFIGFYSTIASSGLNHRLAQLKKEREIQDYKIFDGIYIENILMNYGLTKIILRYFPESYKKIRPLHKITSEFVSLKCDCCGRDLFEDVETGLQNSVIASAERVKNGVTYIEDSYVACKGRCDEKLEQECRRHGCGTLWNDLTDLANPIYYLYYVMCLINRLQDKDHYVYSKKAIENEKKLLMAMGQKVFHEVTDEERQSLSEMIQLGIF